MHTEVKIDIVTRKPGETGDRNHGETGDIKNDNVVVSLNILDLKCQNEVSLELTGFDCTAHPE